MESVGYIMKRKDIKDLLESKEFDIPVHTKGWIRAERGNAYVRFLGINDGSSIQNIQVVADAEKFDENLRKRFTIGAAVSITGKLIESTGKGQSVEIVAENIEILGDADASTYPIQPKAHSMEFLRENAHLRSRTTTFGAIFRLRHALSFAIHKYFNDRRFYYWHSPILTASDAEGAGESFRVTNFDLEDLDSIPKIKEGDHKGKIDNKEDFFGQPTNLTVSGQLEAELGALALGRVYTFGPTFRAENSNTARHLAEFWMIEPEMAFYDLNDNMELVEDFLKYLIKYALDNYREDIAFLDEKFVKENSQKKKEERAEMGLIEKLEFVLANDFKRITYTEAIDILVNSNHYKKGKFQFDVKWGTDLQSEHERFLVEKHFKTPVILYNYPKDIKAFYMRQNDGEEAGKETVAAMDVLFPGIGEIVGGSQREERLDRLQARTDEMGITEELWWYLDTRKFGTVPHAGFGLGFERLMLFVTGMGNIRDVIPFPRTPKNAEF